MCPVWALTQPGLERVNKTVQVGADEATRKKQAEKAYAVNMEVVKEAGLTEKLNVGKKQALYFFEHDDYGVCPDGPRHVKADAE